MQPNTQHILLIKIAFAFWLASNRHTAAVAAVAVAPVVAGSQLVAATLAMAMASSLYAHFISGTLTHCAQYKKLSATDFVVVFVVVIIAAIRINTRKCAVCSVCVFFSLLLCLVCPYCCGIRHSHSHRHRHSHSKR